ncbi:MAG: hypothetical protein LBH81_02585 [Rickettsiales bacterium]|jgi:phage repressor protein C with HTH and peptisase S24 domain|nr:hypothetical protein [Rickettsiales bacterium]
MTHKDVWDMIEMMAVKHGKTVSGLARCAGLDATTFNRSKRFTKQGQERWPSTHSISKIMIATNCSLMDLMKIYFKLKK